LKDYDHKSVAEVSKSISSLREEALKVKAAEIKENLDESKARHFELAQEKGCGSWLTALPILLLINYNAWSYIYIYIYLTTYKAARYKVYKVYKVNPPEWH
jgi:hypothetical protein